ncbi:MAG: hypothetical protein JWO49_2399, partial [Arthrobacter sp.]|nr:hypothetical protein [Arthrobacter sp.]
KEIILSATMTATTVTASGVPRTVVTITLGPVPSSAANLLRPAKAAAAMVWSPAAAVTTPAGSPSSTAPVTETGTSDRDF